MGVRDHSTPSSMLSRSNQGKYSSCVGCAPRYCLAYAADESNRRACHGVLAASAGLEFFELGSAEQRVALPMTLPRTAR